MRKTLLCGALLGALGLAQSAVAQDWDDRWYVSATVGTVNFDNNRDLEDDFMGGLGFGKFFTPNLSVDVDLYYTNPEQEGSDLLWSMYALGVTGRWHWGRETHPNWGPYFAFGGGAQKHEDEFSDPLGGRPFQEESTDLYLNLALGVQGDWDRWGARAEIGPRLDFDDHRPSDDDFYTDIVASVSALYKIGAVPAPAVIPEPMAATTTCADLDDDGDGVNNCDDRCPNSTAGQAIGPDGCPVPLTIDLKNVNFDFDKSTLRPDAVAILDEAIAILRQYPDLRVEVAGHTDSIGSDAYNQGLSERRAQAVYDYLMANGIDSGRLVGPVGYGESRPIAPNTNPDGSDNPEGRAQNRRTELNVQN